MPEARPKVAGGISLVGLLGFALFFELWLNRISARLLRHDPARRLEPMWHRADLAALFLFELASVFGALLFILGLARIVTSRDQRPPFRASIAVVGGVTAALVVGGIVARLPPRLHAHLYMSALFLLAVLVLGALALPASRRLRAGIALLSLPVAAMLAANLIQRLSAPGVLDPRASLLAEGAGGALVVVGLLAPFLFGPEGPGGALAVAAAALTAAGGLVLGRLDWDLTAKLAGIGLGVAIPIGPVALPLYVLGASALVYTTFALLTREGPERLRGAGLFLMGTIGLQLELPYQIAGTLLGLLCIIESAARPAIDAITREELDEHLRRWAALVGAKQVTVVGAPGRERARLSFIAPGASVEAQLLVDRRAGALARFELSVGETPVRTPPFTLSTRPATMLGPAAPGPVIATDDAAFDARFVIRDHRGAGTTLLDPETRTRIARLIDGWVGVWPQRGARYVGRSLPGGDDGLPSLVQLLCDLRERSGA